MTYINTVFPLISTPGTYLVLKLLGAALINGRNLFREVREKTNIKCQNLVIFSFKVRMKHKFSLSINQI